jgi:prepilin-type N-terminal cleavage/methylation domain-containing protein
MHRPARGLTLVEMLVAMAIVAVLAAFIGGILITFGRGRIGEARIQISMIEEALDAYRAEFGRYPPDTGYGLDMESGADAYDAGSLWRYLVRRVKRPASGELAGPFLREWPQDDLAGYADARAGPSFWLKDPWGHPYGFVGERKRVIHNPGGFDIFSAGPDGATASDETGAEPNLAYDGIDNDGNGIVDDASELGTSSRNGEVDDDVNNWD